MQKKITPATRDLFTSTYVQHTGELLRYALRKVSDQDLAEDLVQEAFLKAWSYQCRGGAIQNLKTFLYHILTNSIVDFYRKKYRTLSLDDLLEEGYEPAHDESERQIDILDGNRSFGLVNRLSQSYRSVLTLKYREDLSNREIARLLGKPSANVAVSVHRGLNKLRALHGHGLRFCDSV